MESPQQNSVTRLIGELKAGDADAAAQLWERYFHRLVAVAKLKLGNFPVRGEDEEDVAASVFESLCKEDIAGRLDRVSNRDDLWRLLVTIAQHKATNVKRRGGALIRGGGAVRGESAFGSADQSLRYGGIDAVPNTEPTPESIVELRDMLSFLLSRLKGNFVKPIIQMRMQGSTHAEIARHLGIAVSSVERKLRYVREVWLRELAE